MQISTIPYFNSSNKMLNAKGMSLISAKYFYVVIELFYFFTFYLLILQGERERKGEWEREGKTCCFTHPCPHWLIILCALTRDQIHNLSALEQCSNQWSYPSRAQFYFFITFWFKCLHVSIDSGFSVGQIPSGGLLFSFLLSLSWLQGDTFASYE